MWKLTYKIVITCNAGILKFQFIDRKNIILICESMLTNNMQDSLKLSSSLKCKIIEICRSCGGIQRLLLYNRQLNLQEGLAEGSHHRYNNGLSTQSRDKMFSKLRYLNTAKGNLS